MPEYRLSPQAVQDIESILTRADLVFGETARIRYEALLTRAIMDVAESPERPGSHARNEIATGARTYRLSHSRSRVPKSVGRVHQPRHFLLYRIVEDGKVENGRILRDGMGWTSNDIFQNNIVLKARTSNRGFCREAVSSLLERRKRYVFATLPTGLRLSPSIPKILLDAG